MVELEEGIGNCQDMEAWVLVAVGIPAPGRVAEVVKVEEGTQQLLVVVVVVAEGMGVHNPCTLSMIFRLWTLLLLLLLRLL